MGPLAMPVAACLLKRLLEHDSNTLVPSMYGLKRPYHSQLSIPSVTLSRSLRPLHRSSRPTASPSKRALPRVYKLRAGPPNDDNISLSSSDGTSGTNVDRNSYDPTLAAGFRAPPGERELWWVERFEARRKQLYEQQQQQQQQRQPQQQQQKQKQQQQPSNSNAQHRWCFLFATVQVLQLMVVLAALILWPASMEPGGLLQGRVWLLYLAYLAFFTTGTLHRVLKYGALAPRAKDKQQSTWASRISFLLFITLVPLLHWYPIMRYTTEQLGYYAILTWYELIGGVGLVVAWWLNHAASRELGQAYDRVVAPDKLVTSGVYRWMQHPIYTSYMLLFFSYCMLLHSAPCAILITAVCIVYYRARTALEARVLTAAFGQEYTSYAQRTKYFFPFLV